MRTIFEEEHDLFRASFRDFVDNEMVPRFDEWETAGVMDRQVYADAASYGFVGFNFPERHGGAGVIDFRFNAIIAEELARGNLGGAGNGMTLVNDITTPYFLEYCNDDQAERWMPGLATGELISAIAMTEPGTGSDLAGIQSTAVRDGDDFILNGEQIVPSDWVDAVAQPGVGANYSLQFWLPSGHDQEFIARGAFSNYLWTDTARGFTVAQFGTPPPRDALSTAEHAAAMRAIGDALTD